jgi:hypothetical protein
MDTFSEWMEIGPRRQNTVTNLMDIAVQEDSCQDEKVNSIDDAQAKGRKPSIREVAWSTTLMKKSSLN